MNRKEFVIRCGAGCMGLLGLAGLLESCAGTSHIAAEISGDHMTLPLNAFEFEKKGGKAYRRYVVAENEKLEYPICVYRLSPAEYKALWMRCTHQGTELQVFGDRLQCPAHGSEFNTSGAVQNGPADVGLRTFSTLIEGEIIKIKLS